MAKKKEFNFREMMRTKAGGYIGISLFFIVLLLFYPGNNLRTWIKTRSEIRAQEKAIRKYQLEILEMDKRIRDLTTEKDTLEQFAREEFHFAEPGDEVYLIK